MKKHLSFSLLALINLINAEIPQQPQLLERLKLLLPPPSIRQSNALVSEGKPVDEKIRNIVLKSAPDDVKRLIKIVKDPACPAHLRPTRILVHGSSGCGKTTLGHIFAQEAGLECKYVPASSLGNEYQNSVVANLERIIAGINRPCVLLLDQVDIILKRVKDSKEDVPTQVINILDKLAALNVIVWATTNKLEDIEKPLQTRFSGDAIKMSNPRSLEQRKEIFLTQMTGISHSLCEIATDDVVRKTKKFSIREMESLVRWAHTYAYDRDSKTVDQEDFEKAIKRVEEGRAALENKEGWIKWGKRKGAEYTDVAARGGISGASGTLLTAGIIKILPEDVKKDMGNGIYNGMSMLFSLFRRG